MDSDSKIPNNPHPRTPAEMRIWVTGTFNRAPVRNHVNQIYDHHHQCRSDGTPQQRFRQIETAGMWGLLVVAVDERPVHVRRKNDATPFGQAKPTIG